MYGFVDWPTYNNIIHIRLATHPPSNMATVALVKGQIMSEQQIMAETKTYGAVDVPEGRDDYDEKNA